MSLRKKSSDKLEQMLIALRAHASGLRIRLDRKTTIVIKSEDQVQKWLEMYPDAQIIS